eukprot:jgi/Tetstr1/457605/TSEL_044172.t1
MLPATAAVRFHSGPRRVGGGSGGCLRETDVLRATPAARRDAILRTPARACGRCLLSAGPSRDLRRSQLLLAPLPSDSVAGGHGRRLARGGECLLAANAEGERAGAEAGGAEPEEGGERTPPPEDEDENSLGVRAALAALRFYKAEISPLLPPSCRYFPTCSEYAMQSFKTYGVNKGFVLTAWRLLRCSPFGSRGYDPPKWPPPGLEWLEESSRSD